MPCQRTVAREVFRRIDLTPPVRIAARADCVSDTHRSTSLSAGEVRVGTVEHLLAALSALQIDNVLVDVSAPELPIMDGSAAPFVGLVQAAGTLEQEAPRRFLRVLREVAVADGDKLARFALGAGFENAVVLDTQRVLNPEGLRFSDEFVRHKILDALGDLALLGVPLQGEFRAIKSGHGLNNAAVRALLDQPDAWDLVPALQPVKAAVAGSG